MLEKNKNARSFARRLKELKHGTKEKNNLEEDEWKGLNGGKPASSTNAVCLPRRAPKQKEGIDKKTIEDGEKKRYHKAPLFFDYSLLYRRKGQSQSYTL